MYGNTEQVNAHICQLKKKTDPLNKFNFYFIISVRAMYLKRYFNMNQI